MVDISTLLCEPLKLDSNEFDDLRAFQVAALRPDRTLLEKVIALHHLATRMLGDPHTETTRCGRHYWDIERLLRDTQVRAYLADRSEFEMCISEIEQVSAAHYGGSTPRPKDGYCAGPALNPPEEIRSRLEDEYAAAALLMPHAAEAKWLSFGEVLKRINEHATLL